MVFSSLLYLQLSHLTYGFAFLRLLSVVLSAFTPDGDVRVVASVQGLDESDPLSEEIYILNPESCPFQISGSFHDWQHLKHHFVTFLLKLNSVCIVS